MRTIRFLLACFAAASLIVMVYGLGGEGYWAGIGLVMLMTSVLCNLAAYLSAGVREESDILKEKREPMRLARELAAS